MVSEKQKQRNRDVAKIKASLPEVCVICKRQVPTDAAHLLPKSIYPEYYTKPENIVRLCRSCHDQFDSSMNFRQQQTELYEQVKSFDERAAYRYFGK